MVIKNDKQICINKYGDLWTNMLSTTWQKVEDPMIKDCLTKLYKICRKRSIPQAQKDDAIDRTISVLLNSIEESKKVEVETQKVKTTLQHLIDFFSEFSFEPNFRFVNTLQKYAASSYQSCCEYVSNYFKLTDNGYANAIIEKMKSTEFKCIVSDLHSVPITKSVNTRLTLYYGSQGTGKTTQAIKEADGNCMICHSAMLPSDLMEDFKFEDGKAAFQPSALCKAMTEGKKIVLDEINLLPFESLRFLQSILDGKKEFEYKGNTINIADGFMVIGTMNLVVNGLTYSLPEPLVDRASRLKRFSLTADTLLGALI